MDARSGAPRYRAILWFGGIATTALVGSVVFSILRAPTPPTTPPPIAASTTTTVAPETTTTMPNLALEIQGPPLELRSTIRLSPAETPLTMTGFDGNLVLLTSATGSPEGQTGLAVRTSTDGASWSDAMVAIDESASIRGISRSPAGLVAYGAENDSPAIWTSADGQSWDRYPVEIPDFGGWLAGAVSNGETIMTWGVIGAEPRDPNPVIRTALIDRYGPTVGSQVDYTYALSDNAPGRLIVYGPYGIPIEVLALDEMGVDSSLFQGSPTEPGPTLISQRGSDWQIQELPMSASVSSAFVGPDESLWALAQAPSGPMKAFNLSTDLVWTDRGFLPGTWRYTAAWLDTLLVVQNNPPDVQILSEGWEDRDISFDGWEGMGLVDLVLAPERTGIAFATTGDRSIVAIIREFSMGEPAQSSEPIEFEYSGNVVQVSRDMLTLLRDGALLIEVPLWQLRTGEGVVYDRALQKISLVNPFTGDTYVEFDYAELQELETQHGRQPRFSEVANYLATTPDGCQWTTQVLADVGSLLSVHSVDQWVGLVSSGGDGFEVWVARHNPPVDCD